MRQTRVVLGVRHHDDCGALGIEFAQDTHHFRAVLGIEVSRGFVGKNQFGVAHHRPRDSHALLLAARKLLRKMLGAVAQPHPFENGVDTFLALACLDVEIEQGQFHVLKHVQFVYQVETLKDETYRAFSETCPFAFFERTHFLLQQAVAARGGVVQQAEDIEQRGFSASRGAHNRHELPFFHFHIHTIERNGLHLFGTKHLA